MAIPLLAPLAGAGARVALPLIGKSLPFLGKAVAGYLSYQTGAQVMRTLGYKEYEKPKITKMRKKRKTKRKTKKRRTKRKR